MTTEADLSLWQRIVRELALAGNCEGNVHPHSPDERAELFHTNDGGSTEYEYLNLIYALVVATKPRLVLETGTFSGFGSLALGAALSFNGQGKLITVDAGQCENARKLVANYGLADSISFVQSESVQFCAQWAGESFDFAFFDSDVSVRHRECDVLLQRKKLASGAIAVFHDSSYIRFGVAWSWDMIDYLKRLPGGLTLNLSRGLRIVQF